jgi:hypothetical protein
MFNQILTNGFDDIIKKHVIAFGSLFSSVYTMTERNGQVEKRRVPISFGPKEKFIQLIINESGISDETHIQMDLPRIGFELVNIQYDASRRLNKLKEKRKIVDGVSLKAFSESPYNFTFALYVFSRSMQHSLQVIEQIVPYFTPDFTVTMNMNKLYTRVDVPIVLMDVDINEDYEGTFDQRRSIVSVLQFNMKGYIYSPTKTNTIGIIETTDINFFDGMTGNTFIGDIGYTGNANIGPSSITWSPGNAP